MSTTAVQGQVVAVNGVAKAIDAQGHERILKAGDIIQPGERVVLLDGATLSVARADGELLNVDGPREMALTPETMQPQTTDKTEAAVAKLAPEAQQVLAALENGQDPLAQLDSAAAGLNGAGGADEGSHGFVRLMRVSEALGGALGDGAGGAAFNLPTEQNLTTSNTAVPVNVSIDNISATNDATPTIHGTGIPGLTVIVTNTSGAVIGSAVVGSDGNWTITPTSPLPDGTDTLIATSTNTAGVTATATATAIIDTTPPATPTVTISEHGTPDGVINASELVNGKVEATVKLDAADLAKNGSATIVVNDGGHTTTLVVHADGSVTGTDASVSASYSNGTVTLDIAKPADGSTVTVSATQSDAVGNNSGTATGEAILHATLPTATITVDNVTADNILNIREFSGDMVTITGTVGGDAKLGDKVTLDIGGAHYETTVIDINGQLGFSKVVGTGDLSSATNIHATVSVSDSYNNTATASTDHGYSVDLKAPTIAIDATLAGDNVVNEAEQKQPLTISGTTSGVEDGQTVDVLLNGEHYSATVTNNSWTVDVPAVNVAKLADGQSYTITANVHDLAGNSAAPANHDLGVHVTAPEAFITVDNVTADNILNINEFYGDVVTITGTVGGDAKLDDKVTLDIGGAIYETTVIDINGQLGFSVDVGTGDLSGATKIHATVSVSDSYNNTATASTDHDYLVDLTSPKANITVDPVTADNVLNIQETKGSTVTVTGTVGGDVKVGDTVTLTVNGHDASGQVVDLGNGKLGYSIPVSSDDLKNDSNIHASVTTSSIGGNTGDASTDHGYGLDLQAPTISIDSGLAGDDIVNAAEHKLPLTISGSTSAENGQTVDVVLNGQHYSATVSNGSWSTEVPAADVAKLVDGKGYTITADVSDKAGNPAQEASHKLSVDTSATITILDDGSGHDGMFNQNEAGKVNVTGTTSGVEPGQAVYVTFSDGTNSVSSIVHVQKDGSWSTSGDLTLDLTNLEQGKISVTASVADKAGNPASDSIDNDTLDTDAPAAPTVTITEHNDPNGVISTPDLVNGKVEATVKLDAADLAKSGSATIVVNDGGHTATLVVHADGTITGTDSTVAASYKDGTVTLSLATPADGESVNISATQTDAAGNTSKEATDSGTLLTEGPAAPSVLIVSDKNDDGILNVAETKGHTTVDAVVQLSDMVIQAGGSATVTIVDNGVTSTLTVDKNGAVTSTNPDIGGEYVNGSLQLYNVPLPGDGKTISISAVQADQYGNTSASASDSAVEKLGAPAASITVDPVTADNVLNIKEVSGSTVTITGTVGKDVQPHDIVTLTVNGHATSGEVIDLGGGKLGFSIAVSSADLKADNHVLASVTTSNDAGNSTTATADHAYGLDLNAPTIAIATTLAGDNVINAVEQKQQLTISGSTTGVENGQTVDVVLNGVHYQTTVNGNSWKVTVPQADVAKLADGSSYTITADVSDKAGNPAQEASHKLSVDTSATITILDDGSGHDGTFNQNEAGKVNVTGTTTGVEPGQAVYVTFTDGTNSVSSIVQVQKDGSWSTSGDLTLDLTHLEQGKISVTASVVDKAGNTASDSIDNDTLDTVAPTLTIGTLAGDDIINAKEHTQSLTISGSTSAEDGQKVDVVLNGTHYSANVTGGHWSTTVPAGDVAKLEDGKNYTVTADVRDAAGNPAPEASHTLAVDTTAPDAPKVSFVASGTYSYSNYFGIDDANISNPASGQNALNTVLGDLVNLNPTATFVAQSINFGTSSGAWQDSSLAVKSNLGTSGALQDFITNSHGSTGTDLQLSGSYGTTSRAIVETGGVFTAAAGNYNIAVRADDGYLLMIDGKVVAQEVNNQSPATAWYTVHLDATANNQHTMQIVYWDQGGLATLQVSLEQNGNNIVNLLQPDSTVTAQVTLNANDQAVLVNGGSVHLTGSGNTDLTLHLDNSGKLVDASNNSYSYQNGVISLSMAAPAAGASIALAATVSDKSGNISPSASASYSQPVIPTGHLQHDAANDTGSNNADSITADKTPVITGTADANSQITVTLNGHSYTTSADNTGHWSVSVTDSLGDGVYIPLVKAVDSNGATATGFGTAFAVDTTASITIANDGSGKDGVFNQTEAATAAVSGTTSGVEAGQTVTVTFTDSASHVVTTTTKVGSDGSWSVSPANLSKLTDGAVTVKAQVSDVAGNTATDSHSDKLDTQATIKITNDGSGDDGTFNQNEAGKVNVIGTTSGVEPGQAVYVTFTDGTNSVSSIVHVQKDGSWSTSGDLTLDLTHLEQGKISVTASVVDKAGNTASDSIDSDTLDTQAPLAAQLSSTASTAAITGLFNTGLDASGSAQTAGQADAHYTLESKPAGANLGGTTVVSQTDAQSKSWVTNDYTKSQWIGDMSDLHGTYRYQTTFNIASAADLATVLISFDLSADDNVKILVNGQDTGLSYSKLWTEIQHVDLNNHGALGVELFKVGVNTLTFEVDNSGGGATGLKVDNIVATVQGHALELDVSLTGTGAVANDTLTFTAVENGVSTSTSHVLTSYDISHGVTETAHQAAANTVSTYTATLTDKAGNVSTVATETVFGSGDHAVSDAVGVDTFKWTLASNGNSSAATTTTISNFDLADHASGGSALDLKDLLQGENHASGIGNLTSYLHFSQSGSDTTVHVSASGGFANSTAGDTVDIVLKGVTLADLGGGLAHTSDTQIIQNLLNHGKLITD